MNKDTIKELEEDFQRHLDIIHTQEVMLQDRGAILTEQQKKINKLEDAIADINLICAVDILPEPKEGWQVEEVLEVIKKLYQGE